MLHEITDPDGNTYRRGTAFIFRGDRYRVHSISGTRRFPLLVADTIDPATGVKSRLYCGRARLRYLHHLGHECPPNVFP